MVFGRGPGLSRAERDAVARFRERQATGVGGATPSSSGLSSGRPPPADAVRGGCGLSGLLERVRETGVFEAVFAREAAGDRRPPAAGGAARARPQEAGSRLRMFADARGRHSPAGSRMRAAAGASVFKGRRKAGDPGEGAPADSYDEGAREDDAYFHDLMHDGE